MGFVAIILMVLAICIVQTQLYLKKGFDHVEYTCRFSKDEVTEGEEVSLIETVSNRKWLPLPWLKSELTTSKWLDCAEKQSEILGSRRTIPSFFAVRSYQKISRSWKVRCLKRGVFRIDRVDLLGSDLLGFSSFSKSVLVGAHLTVLPRPLLAGEWAVPPQYTGGDDPVNQRLLADPFFIAGVREYTGHEPMNRIHWKATAHEGSLMVLKNQYTVRQNLGIFLNTQKRPSQTSQMDGDLQLEDCIRFCAYLFASSLPSQTPFCFLCNAPDGSENQPAAFAQESWGESFVLEQFHRLARLEVDRYEPLSSFFGRMDKPFFATEILFVTTYIDEQIKAFAHEQVLHGASVTIFVLGVVLKEDYSDEYTIRTFGDKEDLG